ncbi:MAG: MBL fold metallo-hydrolase [Acidobacteria bacterium]|nr:MBL fold metallo-hydrolase [Acidobacteriota bacterium]
MIGMVLLLLSVSSLAQAPSSSSSDVITTSQGELRITPINHASLMIEFGGKIIHVDPESRGNYTGLPKADLILVTDVHSDHQDRTMVDRLKKPTTVVIAPAAVAKTIAEARVISNGQQQIVQGIKIEAIPMYNLTPRGPGGIISHEKGRGNGYVLTLGGKRLYLSGDTDCITEMKALDRIDIAFVCMNIPSTMTPREAAECVKAFRPKIVYPYHFRQSNLQEFADLLRGTPEVEVRIRNWYW